MHSKDAEVAALVTTISANGRALGVWVWWVSRRFLRKHEIKSTSKCVDCRRPMWWVEWRLCWTVQSWFEWVTQQRRTDEAHTFFYSIYRPGKKNFLSRKRTMARWPNDDKVLPKQWQQQTQRVTSPWPVITVPARSQRRYYLLACIDCNSELLKKRDDPNVASDYLDPQFRRRDEEESGPKPHLPSSDHTGDCYFTE